MSLLRVTDDSTKAELAEAIGHLRLRQLACQLDASKAEIQVTIDSLLERWARADG